jgi:streptomycin 6-kinase
MLNLPHQFLQNVRGVHSETGEAWLQSLPQLIEYSQERWALRVLEPFTLSYNFVAPVMRTDGSEAVLKLCVPQPEVQSEIEALRTFAGNGVCRLLDADASRGILLLERLRPGLTLKSVQDDEEATLIAARLMKRMRAAGDVRHGAFRTVEEWSRGMEKLRQHFGAGTGPIPEALVRRAEMLYPQLCSTVRSPLLLHGDLHHENILSTNSGEWLAIDPKGIIGEADYGVVQFLMNNLPQENALTMTERRVDIFVRELQLQKPRVLAWAFCHAVLSAWWFIEDSVPGVEESIRTATLFEELL